MSKTKQEMRTSQNVNIFRRITMAMEYDHMEATSEASMASAPRAEHTLASGEQAFCGMSVKQK